MTEKLHVTYAKSEGYLYKLLENEADHVREAYRLKENGKWIKVHQGHIESEGVAISEKDFHRRLTPRQKATLKKSGELKEIEEHPAQASKGKDAQRKACDIHALVCR